MSVSGYVCHFSVPPICLFPVDKHFTVKGEGDKHVLHTGGRGDKHFSHTGGVKHFLIKEGDKHFMFEAVVAMMMFLKPSLSFF